MDLQCNQEVLIHVSGGSQVQTDLAFPGELVDDVRLKLRTVDASLPEGSTVAVVLPVVMPVSLLVGTITEH